MKVLYHIDDSKNWEITLNNVAAMLQGGRDTAVAFTIEIVANGPAVKDLQKTAARADGRYARFLALEPAIRLCACNNALRNMQILPSALLPFVQVVPAGVIEIAERQQEGYAYIKP